MQYFEKLLESEKESNQINKMSANPREPKIYNGIYERPQDYLPERETYEALCRGEGVKLVSKNVPKITILNSHIVSV